MCRGNTDKQWQNSAQAMLVTAKKSFWFLGLGGLKDVDFRGANDHKHGVMQGVPAPPPPSRWLPALLTFLKLPKLLSFHILRLAME